MNNRITASIEFYFKGQRHAPSLRIDLDDYIRDEDELAALYRLIAVANGIDLYSYEYEMMQAEELTFSEASGAAAGFLHDGRFDLAGFIASRRDADTSGRLAGIAREYLGVEDLAARPELEAALQAAYRAGRHDAGQAGR